MNFFKKILGWIGPFFKKAAKTTIGFMVEEMREAAILFVKAAENAPAGTDKHKYAAARLREKYPNSKTIAINLAIEMALALIFDGDE